MTVTEDISTIDLWPISDISRQEFKKFLNKKIGIIGDCFKISYDGIKNLWDLVNDVFADIAVTVNIMPCSVNDSLHQMFRDEVRSLPMRVATGLRAFLQYELGRIEKKMEQYWTNVTYCIYSIFLEALASLYMDEQTLFYLIQLVSQPTGTLRRQNMIERYNKNISSEDDCLTNRFKFSMNEQDYFENDVFSETDLKELQKRILVKKNFKNFIKGLNLYKKTLEKLFIEAKETINDKENLKKTTSTAYNIASEEQIELKPHFPENEKCNHEVTTINNHSDNQVPYIIQQQRMSTFHEKSDIQSRASIIQGKREQELSTESASKLNRVGMRMNKTSGGMKDDSLMACACDLQTGDGQFQHSKFPEDDVSRLNEQIKNEEIHHTEEEVENNTKMASENDHQNEEKRASPKESEEEFFEEDTLHEDTYADDVNAFTGRKCTVQRMHQIPETKDDTNNYDNKFKGIVRLLTFSPEALPRYSHHRGMIDDLEESFDSLGTDVEVTFLDDRTPENGQIVVICSDDKELANIIDLVSDEQPVDCQRISITTAVDTVDCIVVLSNNLQDYVIQIDQILKQQYSCGRDVKLCILILGELSEIPIDCQNIRYVSVPLEMAQVRQFISSALENRYLERLGEAISRLSLTKTKKNKQMKRLLREAKSIERSLKHYSVCSTTVPKSESSEIPDEIMTIIKRHKDSIQSYGTRRGRIRIRIYENGCQDIHDEIRRTNIDVDIKSVKRGEDVFVPFTKQGDRLIRDSDQRYGTLGTFANYTDSDGKRKFVALTCAHVCSERNSVSVTLNNQIVGFGTSIEDTCTTDRQRLQLPTHSDLSVIHINSDLEHFCEKFHFYRNRKKKEPKQTKTVTVCTDVSKIPPGKVNKVGAATGWTFGEIRGFDNVRVRGDDNHFLEYFRVQTDDNSSKFAEGGDSGAIVSTMCFDDFTRFHVSYLGIVVGGPPNKNNNQKFVRPLTEDAKITKQTLEQEAPRNQAQFVDTRSANNAGPAEVREATGYKAPSSTKGNEEYPGLTTASRAIAKKSEPAEAKGTERYPGSAAASRTTGNSEYDEAKGTGGYPGITTASRTIAKSEPAEAKGYEGHPGITAASRATGNSEHADAKVSEGHIVPVAARGAEGHLVPAVDKRTERNSEFEEYDEDTSSSDSSLDTYCINLHNNLQKLKGRIDFDFQ